MNTAATAPADTSLRHHPHGTPTWQSEGHEGALDHANGNEAWLAQLRQDEVDVWMVSLPASAQAQCALEPLLSPHEQARATRLLVPAKRRDFITCRGALRVLLGRYLQLPAHEVRIVEGAQGKPMLAPGGPRLHFNLTHTQGLMLVALSAGMEVGIDVEHLRPVEGIERVASRYFSEQERASSTAGPEGFLRLWTTRESALKACGTGISAGWDALRIVDRGPGAADAQGLGHSCHIRRFTPDFGFVAAIAAMRSDFHLRPMRTLDLDALTVLDPTSLCAAARADRSRVQP